MKWLSLFVVFFSVTNAQASNYPADYCLQKVYSISEGPSLFSRVRSGCLDQVVIGYKNSGVLAGNDINEIHAVITASCNSTSNVKVINLVLGKEWNGTGYINKLPYIILPDECYRGDKTSKFSVAFSDGKGNWDSRYGLNYNVFLEEFYTRGEVNQSTSLDGVIGLDSWNIIINKMKL